MHGGREPPGFLPDDFLDSASESEGGGAAPQGEAVDSDPEVEQDDVGQHRGPVEHQAAPPDNVDPPLQPTRFSAQKQRSKEQHRSMSFRMHYGKMRKKLLETNAENMEEQVAVVNKNSERGCRMSLARAGRRLTRSL